MSSQWPLSVCEVLVAYRFWPDPVRLRNDMSNWLIIEKHLWFYQLGLLLPPFPHFLVAPSIFDKSTLVTARSHAGRPLDYIYGLRSVRKRGAWKPGNDELHWFSRCVDTLVFKVLNLYWLKLISLIEISLITHAVHILYDCRWYLKSARRRVTYLFIYLYKGF